jgi:hypothetical protein
MGRTLVVESRTLGHAAHSVHDRATGEEHLVEDAPTAADALAGGQGYVGRAVS